MIQSILTPEGSQPIELLEAGDIVLTRQEDDPNAPLERSTVEAVFPLQAQILEVHAGGRVSETTLEHPS